MYELFFILFIILYITSVIGCLTFPIFLKLLRQRNYSLSKVGINCFSFIIGRIIYPSFFIFSLILAFPFDINANLFKTSIIIGFLDVGLLILSISSNKSKSKWDYVIFIVYLFLYGLLIGTLIGPNSIKLIENYDQTAPFIVFNLSNTNYEFDIFSQIVIVLFFVFLIIIFMYYALIIHLHSRDKNLSKMLLLINIALSSSFLFFIIYVLTGYTIFREIYFIIVQILLLLLLLQYLQGYGIPMSNITSKIYSINIYHKSGVQLYSYNFDYKTGKTESSIWGNILIGLNHIMGEFIDTNNQINVMQTKNSDIIVDYNNEYGFAVILIINKNNTELSKMMREFTQEFEQNYKNELNEIQDLNNLIDISEFKGVEELIKKHFPLFF